MSDVLKQSDDAIEELGNLVAMAGGDGDEALDVFKDAVSEVQHLRKALEWYANPDNYDAIGPQGTVKGPAWRVAKDNGDRARRALGR